MNRRMILKVLPAALIAALVPRTRDVVAAERLYLPESSIGTTIIYPEWLGERNSGSTYVHVGGGRYQLRGWDTNKWSSGSIYMNLGDTK